MSGPQGLGHFGRSFEYNHVVRFALPWVIYLRKMMSYCVIDNHTDYCIIEVNIYEVYSSWALSLMFKVYLTNKSGNLQCFCDKGVEEDL